ncbi:hypothetical protein R4172_17800 [Rhodococcus kroppenstedtii]|uniref:Unannotated protein n=1 Tax=freshwater metagenome TaxID=449393 RepID=A0A6J7HXL1_9ZZZZ|nr:hypothetical protein [Rhodococcus kroppenstedtii]MDV7199401.1 hypothetical protein [Rhodococcus kroppenstedtii]
MPGYATARSALTLLFLRLDDGVMSLGLSEKATTERERDSTLRPSAWFLDNVDNGTLAKIADLVCNRGHVTARRGGRVGGLPRTRYTGAGEAEGALHGTGVVRQDGGGSRPLIRGGAEGPGLLHE